MRCTLRSAVLSLVLATLLTACAAAGSRQQDQRTGAATADSVVATVVNDSYYNLTVYIADDARRDRLGEISSFGEAVFELPEDFVSRSGQIRLFADPVGATFLYRSAAVSVTRGQYVEWTVKIDPDQSRATIRVLNK